jgi:hypothetical protein
MRRRFAHVAICALFLASLAQCAKKKSKSDGAEFGILPEKPIVILGDTKDSSGNDIKGPWFNFRVNMMNGTEDIVTIVALVLEVYAQDSSGQIVKADVAFTPAAFDFTLSEDKECKFSTFGTWTVGEKKGFLLENSDPTCTRIPVFYIGNNPSGISGKNYRYRVKVKPMGWFGTYDDPTDRFDKSFSFYTQ